MQRFHVFAELLILVVNANMSFAIQLQAQMISVPMGIVISRMDCACVISVGVVVTVMKKLI